MVAVSSYSSLGLQLSNYYQTTRKQMAGSLLRLTSGKKVLNPSDDIGNYIRGKDFQLKTENYKVIKEDLQEWQGTLSVAEDSADSIYDMLVRLKELANMAKQTADVDKKAAYNDEFQQIVDDIENTRDNTTYNGYTILNTTGSLATVRLDDSSSPNELDITLNKVITDANLTAGGANALQEDDISDGGDADDALTDIELALGDVETFLSTVGSKKIAVESHLNITNSVMENAESARANLMDINEAEEMMSFTKHNIRQQAAMAMIAQANMSRSSVLTLYGNMQ
jgi:flagellin